MANEWRKVHWVLEEYPWGVLEIDESVRSWHGTRPADFGPLSDERIVAHCFHEADADTITRLQSDLEQANRERGQLREALARYGRHGHDCSKSPGWEFSTLSYPAAPCDCGLDAALTPSPTLPQAQREEG